MRASATSKISSAASYAAAQAKPNAAKADEASPFALLVGTVAPKDANRPPVKDVSNSTDNGADKSAKTQDDQTSAGQTASSASANSKPEKSDKSSNKDETRSDKARADKAGDDKDSDRQVLTDSQTQDQQAVQQASVMPDQQDLPPPPPAAPIAIGADGESDDLALDPAASTATDIKIPATLQAKADIKAGAQTGTPAKTPVKPAAAADAPAVAEDSNDNTDDSQITEPASQTATAASDRRAIVQNSGAKNADVPSQTPSDTDIQTAAIASDQRAIVQNSGAKTPDVTSPDAEAPQDIAPQEAAAKSDSTEPTGKSNGIKSTAPKSRAAQVDTNDKADAAKSDAPKNDAPKPAAPQPDISQVTSAPKPTPHPAAQAIFAVNTIAAPQAQASAVAMATANTHGQDSTEATPDLPLLAVAIAGKSQSGAKQFDIRLDPPELGRVEVRLSIDATGKASAHLSADQPQTLTLLQKDAPVLARALREAGLDVSQDGLNFSLRQQNENQSGNAGNNGRRGSVRSLALSASISIDATASNAAYRGIANGRVDIRV